MGLKLGLAFFLLSINSVRAADLPCPVGWTLSGDPTECIKSGAVFVALRGEWWQKVGSDPTGMILFNALRQERLRFDFARISELQTFVGQGCRWNVYPFPEFFHAQKFSTTDGRLYQCNNGTIFSLGKMVPPSPAPRYYSPRRHPHETIDEYHRREEGDQSKDPGSGIFYKS